MLQQEAIFNRQHKLKSHKLTPPNIELLTCEEPKAKILQVINWS